MALTITPKIYQNSTQALKAYQSTPNNISASNNYPNLKPLAKDSVSFTGGEKILEKRTKDISWKVMNEASNELEPITQKIVNIFKREFKPLMATTLHPERPVFSIHGRTKGAGSLGEKGISRNRKTKQELKNIGDAIGLRITMGDSSQDAFDRVFDIFGVMVKKGHFKVKEIENYRLTRKDSYVSSKTLDKFEDVCQGMKQYPSRSGKAIPNGYTAVHLTLETPDGQLFEVQIMGINVEELKELEDFYYKKRCNKDLPLKYAPIQKMLNEKMDGLDEMQQEFLTKYILDSYIHAKSLPKRSPKQRTKMSDFLPIPYFLPKELSFENLHKMKMDCDVAYKASQKQAKATSKTKNK